MANGVSGDEQLIALVQRGDEAALSMLYDRYAPVVLGLLTRIIGEPAVAEEALQEVFWRVWDKSSSFDPSKASFKTWLFTIARRLAIDTLRRRNVRPQPLISDSAEMIIESQPAEINIPNEVNRSLNASTVHSALSGLPSEQRQVIELAYFQGKTRREIADETDIPLGTIHTRARLALKRMHKILSDKGMEGSA